ncbi:MAG: CHAP domain-containing protein [Ktedonobacterales bacterium]
MEAQSNVDVRQHQQQQWRRGRQRRRSSRMLGPLALALLFAALLSGCAGQGTRTADPSPTATARLAPFAAYVDARLGFSIALAPGWTAHPSPGLRTQANVAAVTLVDGASPGAPQVLVSVLRGGEVPAAFAMRGAPTTTVGPYPAFAADTSAQVGRVPCLIRGFLAHDDYVVGEECAGDAQARVATFNALLASYLPLAPPNARPVAVVPPTQADCAAVQRGAGYDHAPAGWGRTLAQPASAGWRALAPGAFVCSNTGSPDLYLFQCTELVNRLNWELFDLPRFTAHSELYFDYYQGGARQPGQVRALLLPGTYALADDATQGASAFAPAAGDLLVFQDVNDARQGWTSGIRAETLGHVAIITAVDATHVYVAQQNYNDTQFFLALPLTHTATGWHVTDLSGVPNRIVRGWIHLTPPVARS